MLSEKFPSKKFIYIAAAALIFLFIEAVIYFSLFKIAVEAPPILPTDKTTLEEFIRSLTVPKDAKVEPLKQKVLQDLSVPKKAKIKPLSPDVIEDLTVPK